MKKRSSLILALIMLLTMCINTSAAYILYTPESAGSTYYTLNLGSPISLSGANVSGSSVNMSSASSTAEYEIHFDTDIESVTVTYQASANRKLYVSVDGNSHEVTLSSGSTSVTQEIIERKGPHNVILSINGAATISSVAFHKCKIDEFGIDSEYNQYNIAYDDYDKAMQTAVVVSTSRNAIKVNGAFRYLDYTNTKIAPLNIDGRIYLPIHAAARAFSLYYEDYPDKAYAYMSNDDFELRQKGDDSYVVINGEKFDNYGRFAIYLNGTTWVPFRQLAELVGDKVEFRSDISGNGYAVADDRVRVKAIVSNDTIFQSLVNEFAQFDISNITDNKTYYVSQASGSDSNNGLSESTPFKTIQKAADYAKAGDTVIIHSGVYREEVKPQNSGTATQPIIFKAADGENVTISAFDKVSGFTKSSYRHNGYDLYETKIKSLGYDRNFVIMNDQILREGRYPDYDTKTVSGPHPNLPDNVMRATMGDITMPRKDGYSKTFTYKTKNETSETSHAYNYDIALSESGELNQTKNFWKGATFVGLTGEAFTLSYAYIDASGNRTDQGDNIGWIHLLDENRYGYDFVATPSETDLFYMAKQPYDYGYITHHIETVTQPGEWYVDHNVTMSSGLNTYNSIQNNRTLYIIPPQGVSGSSLEVEVKQRQRVIDLRNKKFVQFHNINTRGGGVTMAGDTEMDIIDGGTHKYISQIDMSGAHATHDGRYIYPRNEVYIKREDGPELGEVGFFSHGKNNAFVNTHIAYSAFAGIYTTGLYTFIENNFIENASYMGTYPGAVTLEGVKWNTYSQSSKFGGHSVIANSLVGSGRGNLYLSRGISYKNGYKEEKMYPYIACDLSYNRLQMGAVSTRDTGNFYAYGIMAGNDLIKTRLHHNIIYDLGTKAKYSSMNALIYHDGYSSFINTFSNMTFDTEKGYVSDDVYQHTAQQRFRNFVEKWGNLSLGTVSSNVTVDLQDTFSKKDYPYGKPFDVGSTRDGHDRFMLNYNEDPNCVIKYAGEASDATLANGAVLDDDGFVTLPNSSSYIDFKNVKFYDTGTEFSIFYSSDKYQYGKNVGTAAKPKYESEIPKFTIELYRNGASSYERQIVEDVYLHAVNLDNESRYIMYFKPQTAATYTVRVKCSKSYVRPCKLMTGKCDFNAKAAGDWPYPLDGDTILFGTLTNSGGTDEKENLFFDELSIHNKINHTYSNVSTSSFTFTKKFTDNQTKVSMRVSTDYQYVNGKVRIYLDGTKSNNLISEFYINDYIDENGVITGKAWMPIVITKQLSKTITAEEHTVKIEFSKRNSSGSYPVLSTFWVSFHSLPFSGSSPTLAQLQQQGS